MKNTIKLLGVIAIIAAIGFSMTACPEPEPEPEPDPAPKFTGVQVYTLEDGVFTAYSGTGTAMDVKGFLSDNDSEHDIGKIGTISGDGKLTFELPSTIADDKLFLVSNEYGGNGVTKFALVTLVLSGYSLDLLNSQTTNPVFFEYFDRDFSAMGLSVKKGWNYLEWSNENSSYSVILDISNHKWVIDEEN